MERFGDIIGMAQAHVEMETEGRIRQIRNKLKNGSGSDCRIDCGGEIPADRRKYLPGAVRCVPCQNLRESSRQVGAIGAAHRERKNAEVDNRVMLRLYRP